MKTYDEMMEIASPAARQAEEDGVPVHQGVVMPAGMLRHLLHIDPSLLPAEALALVLTGIAQFAQFSTLTDDDLREALAIAIRMRDTLNARSETVAREHNRRLS